MLEIPAVELRQRVEEEIQENPLLEEVPEWEKGKELNDSTGSSQDEYEDDYLYGEGEDYHADVHTPQSQSDSCLRSSMRAIGSQSQPQVDSPKATGGCFTPTLGEQFF